MISYNLEIEVKKAISDAMLGELAKMAGVDARLKLRTKIYDENPETLYVWVDFENPEKGSLVTFQLTGMPSCSGIVVSHGVYIYHDYQKKGIGTLLNKLRCEVCKRCNVSLMVCTVSSDNLAERKVLLANGWFPITRYQQYNFPVEMWNKHL